MIYKQLKEMYDEIGVANQYFQAPTGTAEKKAAANNLEKIIKDKTGQVIQVPLNPNDEQFNSIRVMNASYQNKAITYVKENIDQLIQGVESEKLFGLIANFENKDEKYSEFNKLLNEYKDYSVLFAPEEESNGKDNGKRKKALERLNEKAPEIVYKRISETVKDEEEAKMWTAVILGLAPMSRDYIPTILNQEAQKIQEDLKNKMEKNGFATSYIKDSLKTDQDYLAFGAYLIGIKESDKEEKTNQ